MSGFVFKAEEPPPNPPGDEPKPLEDEIDDSLNAVLSDNVDEHEFGVLSNPLLGLTRRRLRALGRGFAIKYGLRGPDSKNLSLFADAAVLAQHNEAWQQPDEWLRLSSDDIEVLRLEVESRWSQPKKLYSLITLCAAAAAVQGWNQTASNGANIFYSIAFGIADQQSLWGLVDSAPYLCCAFSCIILTPPMNRYLGRRWTVFLTCLISSLASLGQAFTMSWQQMFAARFILGMGIGPKAATVPVYAAESAPVSIRGALVMMWQTFTAFGIFLGLLMGVIFFNVNNAQENPACSPGSPRSLLLSRECSLRWRLMVGVPMILPLLVCIHTFFVPESPRWYMKRGEKFYPKAFISLCQFRNSELQAARDLFYIHCLLHAERDIKRKRQRFVEMVKIPRNRRALQASLVVMGLQQACGVNILVHFSSHILNTAINNRRTALLGSMGFGLINFVFALPAVRIIDTRGRRFLLLTTFPLMAAFMLLTGIAFVIDDLKTRTGVIMVGIYLFAIAYSPGEGPVPFTYSAECYPLYVRDIGMAIATSANFLGNFCVSMTLPKMIDHSLMKKTGTLIYYCAWNVAGFFLILFFVPETKNRSLEELDRIFSVPTRRFAMNAMQQLQYFFRRKILRAEVERPPKLHVPGDDEKHMSPPSIVRFEGKRFTDLQGVQESKREGRSSSPPHPPSPSMRSDADSW